MEFSEHLANYSIRSLWYITHIDNLESILTRGILSHNLVEKKKLRTTDISYWYVQRLRGHLHSFVPLYFADNTPMLYKVVEKDGEQIVLLEISTEATNINGIKFTKGNAASTATVLSNPEDLERLKWDIIKDRRGAFGCDKEGRDWIFYRAAEVLIPDKVLASHILRIYTQNARITDKVKGIINECGYDKIKITDGLTAKGI